MSYMPDDRHEFDCRAAVERLWAYLDDELDASVMAQVEAHLASCAECPPHFDFARTLLGEIRLTRGSSHQPSDLRAHVLHALELDGFQAVAS